MYLKKIEIIGFKSFAERTVLNFEPGMTAIVGPNGCGKSNVADAVRWVLGEQSAKALRGGKMQDVIFNGAESMKAMNLAEVSLTLADCETALQTEYNEVTVTRRVFRNGDSQYFLNKAACRLKDIQRLFMDTGVGRGSYSILEQGKIDQILSSRPDDRRVVFEEASGITKYKADRKEALRKLEHTEQNLARLEDVIREVKRRMISLQRQAGKARRYREIEERLRGRDLWLSRHTLDVMQTTIGDLEVKLDELTQRCTAERARIHEQESEVETAREELEQTDKVIADVMETAVGLRNELNNAQHSIKVNTERIQEMEAYASRDARDAQEAQSRLEQHRSGLQELQDTLKATQGERDEASRILEDHRKNFQTLEEESKALREQTHAMRTRAHNLEQQHGTLQRKLRDYDERERGRLVKQERLQAEVKELKQGLKKRETKVAELSSTVEELRDAEKTQSGMLNELIKQQQERGSQIREQRAEWNQLQQQAAALIARLEILRSQEEKKEDFAGGARILLGKEEMAGLDKSKVIGALAEQFRAEPEAQRALESVLRVWLDAVVVTDQAALRDVLQSLKAADAGAARLLTLDDAPYKFPSAGPGRALLDLVKFDDSVSPLADRLLGGVRLVESVVGEGTIEPGLVLVDADGNILRGNGSGERYAEDASAGNPLARQADIATAEEELGAIQGKAGQLQTLIDAAQSEEAELQNTLKNHREEVQKAHRNLASREGELRVQTRDLRTATDRLAKAEAQFESLLSAHSEKDEERNALVEGIDSCRKEQDSLRLKIEKSAAGFDKAETERNAAAQQVTEHRIRFAECQQQAGQQERQIQNLVERIKEFETTIEERSSGASTHKERVETLKKQIQQATEKLSPLEKRLEEENAKLSSIREERSQKLAQVQEADKQLREKRAATEKMLEEHGKLEVDVAQRRVRYENVIQRVTETYNLTLPEVQNAEEPDWDGADAPDWTGLEQEVGMMKAKLEAMGPVNLVAIEEFQEQEDRYQFLMEQQQDLVQAKEQFLETIKTINVTTTEMFINTFNQVNENFREMFKVLFGGGEANLELTDSEDVLDSGVDIIARPPGKKPQTISLLSGGERTMTAVALLFALYKVKPSPFCVLDELDAALDDANIGRFIAMLQSFLSSSQFIVITHNQKTIAAADVLYGVTQQRKGISKIVSVKLTDHDKDEDDVRRSKQLETAGK